MGTPTRLVDETGIERFRGTQVGGGGSIPLADPTGIPGLLFWLDAAQLAGAHGDPIATWPDLSGNGYDATQAVSDNQPTLDLETIPPLPFVNFDPSENAQFLAFSGDALDMFNGLSGVTFCVVLANRDQAQPETLFGANSAGEFTQNKRLYLTSFSPILYSLEAVVTNDDDAGGSQIQVQGGAFQEATAPAGWAATTGIVSFDLASGFSPGWEGGIKTLDPLDLYPDNPSNYTGALNKLAPLGPTQSAPCTSILLSGDGQLAFNPWDGGVVSIAVYGRALKASERRQLLEWVSDTYGTA